VALLDRFLAEHVPAGASGQVRSVAARFGLIAAAGELARDYSVLPWPEGEAQRAAGACFRAWLAERGGVGAAEDKAALAQVRAFIESHGESRFTPLVAPGEAPPEGSRTINRAGWRRRSDATVGGEGWEYLVLPEVWRAEVCKGSDPKRAAAVLRERGLLLGATDRWPAARVRIPGEGQVRVYRILGTILAGDSEDGNGAR